MKKFLFLNLIALCFIFSCVSSATTGSMMQKINSEQLKDKDYRVLGSGKYSSTESSIKSDSGCKVKFTQFVPENHQGEMVVILGHGFFRNQKTQKELAQHLASWGLHVVTMDFCNSRPWNGHHDKNGADMVKVADVIGAKSVIYSGFSAGGLAAFIASSQDARTKAYFGLDMVDNFDKGIEAAPQVKAPIFGLIAESSMCNAKNNGLDVYAKTEQKVLFKVSGATHCDFEYPFDKLCSIACGKNEEPYTREDIQETILGLTTALFLWQSGVDLEAKSWWEKDSEKIQLFINSKRLEVLNK